MRDYILRRLGLAFLTALAISALIFLIMRLLPGDPLSILIGSDQDYVVFSDDERAKLLHDLGSGQTSGGTVLQLDLELSPR